MVFLDQMRAHGQDGGLLMIPGSTADFTGTTLNSLRHPLPAEQVEAIFTTDKAAYIADYADRMAPVLAAQKAGWAAAAGEPLLQPLRTLFEPIMLQSNEICDGIGYPVELAIGPETIVLDFPKELYENRFPTRGSATGSRSRRSWCARCCATTNPTGSTPSSYPPISGMAGWWLQRIPLHVLQVSDRRTHRLRRRLVRRGPR